MTSTGSVVTYAETCDGRITQSALEAARWCRRLGVPVEAVAPHVLTRQDLIRLGDCGVVTVHVPGGEAGTGSPPSGPVAAAISAVAARRSAALVVLAGSVSGRDVAGRLAVRLDAPVVARVEDAGLDPLTVRSAAFGGALSVATAAGAGGRLIAVLAPGSAVPGAAAGAPPPMVMSLPAPAAGSEPVVISRSAPEAAGAPLEEAQVIVAGGRGMRGPEGFELVRTVAGLLGGTVAASRGAVDAGWAPASAQVGQSGRTVAPALYIACGISGAMQHLAGIRRAGTVIAINSDPAAPIFARADLAVVGDAAAVLRRLIAELGTAGEAGKGGTYTRPR